MVNYLERPPPYVKQLLSVACEMIVDDRQVPDILLSILCRLHPLFFESYAEMEVELDDRDSSMQSTIWPPEQLLRSLE